MKLFDLDGTLLDSNGLWREIDVQFLAKRGIPWTPEYNEGVIHAIFPIAAQFTRDFCHLEETPEEIMAEWLEMAREGYARTLKVKDGVMDYLDQCLQTGERMALFTSAEPSLCHAALSDRGFDRYLTDVVFAQHLGMEKRSPAAFRKYSLPAEEMRFTPPSGTSIATGTFAAQRRMAFFLIATVSR